MVAGIRINNSNSNKVVGDSREETKVGPSREETKDGVSSKEDGDNKVEIKVGVETQEVVGRDKP